MWQKQRKVSVTSIIGVLFTDGDVSDVILVNMVIGNSVDYSYSCLVDGSLVTMSAMQVAAVWLTAVWLTGVTGGPVSNSSDSCLVDGVRRWPCQKQQ